MLPGCRICASRRELQVSGADGFRLPEKTVVDRIFRALCFINGLHVGAKPRRWQTIPYKLIWLCTAILHIGVVSKTMLEYSVTTEDKPSLTVLLERANDCLYVVTNLYVVFVFITKRDLINTLLQTRNRRFSDLVIPLAAMLPYTASASIFLTGDETVQQLLLEACTEHGNLIMTGFNLLYTDVLRNNHELLQDILRSVRELELNNLTEKKWHVREQIRKTNDIFAWILSAYYLQILVAIVLSFGGTLSQETEFGPGCVIFLALSSFMLQHWRFASTSSDCISKCHEAEINFSKLVDRADTVCETCQMRYFRLLHFRGEYDSLRVGCFSQNTPNFLSYLITCITCLAVVLQFDFKVMGAMTKLAERNHGSSAA